MKQSSKKRWGNLAKTTIPEVCALRKQIQDHPGFHVFNMGMLCADCFEEAMLSSNGKHNHEEIRRIDILTLAMMLRIMNLYFPVRDKKK